MAGTPNQSVEATDAAADQRRMIATLRKVNQLSQAKVTEQNEAKATEEKLALIRLEVETLRQRSNKKTAQAIAVAQLVAVMRAQLRDAEADLQKSRATFDRLEAELANDDK